MVIDDVCNYDDDYYDYNDEHDNYDHYVENADETRIETKHVYMYQNL